MRGDDKNLNFGTRLAIKDVVWKAQYSTAANTREQLDTIPVWILANLDHCRLKCRKITRTECRLAFLIVGDVFKVFNPRRLAKEVAHLSKAWA